MIMQAILYYVGKGIFSLNGKPEVRVVNWKSRTREIQQEVPSGPKASAPPATNQYTYQNQHHIKPAANFVISHGPAFGVERWEEQSGYSPFIISAETAGLVATADITRINGDMQRANDASPA